MSKKPGITAKKNEDFSEWYTQVCSPQGAGLADNRYPVKGAIVHLPWGFKILRRIYELLEEEIEADNHEPVLFPTFIEEESLQKEEEHSGFAPEVYWVTEAGSNELDRKLALRPTGETQIYPMYSQWLRSHADLPMKYYQSRITVFRYESHARPFMRGREFMFFETHDVFETQEGVDTQIATDHRIMREVFTDTLKIPFKFLRRPEWDKFLGAERTYAADTLMPDGKRNQMSSTHDFGTKFAEAYDLTYADEDGEQQHPLQTAFGPGIWRIMASIIGIHGDDNGLVLPSSIAPKHVVIVPITFGDEETNKEILATAKELKDTLEPELNVDIDTQDRNPGWKFNQWEMKGVPLRIELGPRDLKNESFVLAPRLGDKQSHTLEDVEEAVHNGLKRVDSAIEDRAQQYFADNTRDADSYKEVLELLDTHRGFVRAPFIGITGEEAEQAADKLQEDSNGGYVCGVVESEDSPVDKECVVTGQPAKYYVYIAKSL